MKSIWGIIATIVVSAMAISAAVLLLPLGDTKPIWALFTFVSLLYVGVAVLYATGLKGFTDEFKKGYWYLAISMVLFAIGVLELPVFSNIVAESEEGPLAMSYYLAVVPILVSVGLYYLGVRKIAKIIAIKTIFLSQPFIVGAALVAGLLVGPITFFTTDDSSPLSLAIPFGVLAIALTIVIACVVLLFKLRQGVSVLYRPAFAWNFYGFLALFVSQILDPSPLLPPGHWYVQYGLALPLLPSALCFLKGAFEFNRISDRARQLTSHTDNPNEPRVTSIDVVLSVAQLVSNPKLIDPELDKVRNITSQLKEGQTLTDAQQTELATVYKYLEDYLVQKEPARTYKSNELRQLVEVKFRGSVNEPTFWSTLQSFRQ